MTDTAHITITINLDPVTLDSLARLTEAIGRLGHQTAPAEPTETPAPVDPVEHRCQICGATFATGQGLGGHKRAHRPSKVTPPPVEQPPRPTVDLFKVARVIATRPANVKPHEAVMRTYGLGEAAARREVIACRDRGLLPTLNAGAPIPPSPFDAGKARQRAADAL